MSCGPYAYCRPGTLPACEPPLVKEDTVPCHADTPTWGNVYEGKDYPVTYKLTGSAATAQWFLQKWNGTDVIARLDELNKSTASYFSFTRVTGSSLVTPLQDGEVVRVRVNNPRDTVVRPLYWRKVVEATYTYFALSFSATGTYGDEFVISTRKQCGDVLISLTPNDAALEPTTVSALCTSAPGATVSPVLGIIWPNYPDWTPERQVIDIKSAFGEWAWTV